MVMGALNVTDPSLVEVRALIFVNQRGTKIQFTQE